MLDLRFCARAFSSCGKRGPLFIAVRGPLTIAASLVAEHSLQSCRLSSCGSQAQPLRGMWDLPRPGLEPVSPALADSQSPHHQGSPRSLSLNPFCFYMVCEPRTGFAFLSVVKKEKNIQRSVTLQTLLILTL